MDEFEFELIDLRSCNTRKQKSFNARQLTERIEFSTVFEKTWWKMQTMTLTGSFPCFRFFLSARANVFSPTNLIKSKRENASSRLAKHYILHYWKPCRTKKSNKNRTKNIPTFLIRTIQYLTRNCSCATYW